MLRSQVERGPDNDVLAVLCGVPRNGPDRARPVDVDQDRPESTFDGVEAQVVGCDVGDDVVGVDMECVHVLGDEDPHPEKGANGQVRIEGPPERIAIRDVTPTEPDEPTAFFCEQGFDWAGEPLTGDEQQVVQVSNVVGGGGVIWEFQVPNRSVSETNHAVSPANVVFVEFLLDFKGWCLTATGHRICGVRHENLHLLR